MNRSWLVGASVRRCVGASAHHLVNAANQLNLAVRREVIR
jgi:hypothetical protein